MDLHAILIRTPIDRTAYRVTDQSAVVTSDAPITKDDLASLVQRLTRKQRLLKLVLGIKTKRQHENTMYKIRHRIPQYRAGKEPRALAEYWRLGQEIQRLSSALAEMRKARTTR